MRGCEPWFRVAARTVSSRVARRHPGAGSQPCMVEFAGPIAGEQPAPPPVILSSERAPASSLLYPASCGRHVEPHHVSLRASRHPHVRDVVPVVRPRPRTQLNGFEPGAVKHRPANSRNAAVAATALPRHLGSWGKLALWPVQRARASRSPGAPARANPCCPVPTFHSYTDGQMTVRRS
jgi:hypothetical protein